MDKQEIDTIYKVADALGSPLEAPANSLVFYATGWDADGDIIFSEIHSSEESAQLSLSKTAIEYLEELDGDAPWMSFLDYGQREAMPLHEYNKLFETKRDKWIAEQSVLAIIESFWEYNGWSIDKVKVK